MISRDVLLSVHVISVVETIISVSLAYNCKQQTHVVHCRNPIKLICPLLSQIFGCGGQNGHF